MFYFLVQCRFKTILIEMKESVAKNIDKINSNISLGYDYMIDKNEQVIQAGEPLDIQCIPNAKISKCYFYKDDGELRYLSRPGVSFEGGRIRCLCDVKPNLDAEKVCGVHIISVKDYDAGDWRCEAEFERNGKSEKG